MTRIHQDLSGCKWQMERMRPGQGEAEGLHLLPAEYQGTTFSWNFASVPGDVYTDLFRMGELDDPNFGRNMHRAKWVQEYEWWYQRRFEIDPQMKGKQISLIFEGVDYSCEVWLNGEFLGRHEGMFSEFKFDITDIVSYEDWRDGSNNLMIKLDPPPKNYRNCGGKKVNFSGDYFSGLVPFGIWRPVRIEATERIHVKELRSDVTLIDENTASVQVEAVVNNLSAADQDVQLAFSLFGKNCETEVTTLQVSALAARGETVVKTDVVVNDAKLWWPWDMGDQNLYQLKAEVIDGTETLDEFQQTIGLREVTMEMNSGFTEEEAEFPWTFKINGKRHFLRSACWGGQPSFFYGRNHDEKYQHRLAMVKEANINNLRIFGWHPPEIPEFYRLCDELGITVWTNFTLATQAYPKDESFIQGVLHECIDTVKQRRHHPSQIFWMGGEEVFFSGAHEESGNKILMERIGETVNEYTAAPYGLASPLSSPSAVNMGFKPKESIHANEHYYMGGAEFMEEYYPALDCAIIPELTAASAPNIESLKKFIPEDELWPMGPSWAYHWADIDILINLNFEVLDDYKLDSLESFVEATQIAQGTVIQYALETYRRRKPKMSGVALCHFITHVPDIKWGVVDYYGEKKRSFEYLKRTYQPLLPSLAFEKRRWNAGEEFHGELWVVNDFQAPYDKLTLEWEVFYQGQSTGRKDVVQINVEADSSSHYTDVSWLLPQDAEGNFEVHTVLRDDAGNKLANNEYLLLVGDQQAAKLKSLEYLEQNKKRIANHGHCVYRYWPDMWKID